MGRGNTLPPAVPAPNKKPGRKPKGINLGKVAEVLIARGLDPTEELVDILQKTKPVTLKDGTQAQVPVLDDDVRAKVLLELQQYVAPKLKAIEVKVDGTLELTNEQIDARLKQLLGDVAIE